MVWRGTAILAAACAFFPVVLGAVGVRQDVVVPVTNTIPVTLSAGSAGSTTLGSSATSATTTGVVLPGIGSSNVLVLNAGAVAWSVKVRLVSDTGFGVTDNAVVAITDGTTTRNQVVVVLGTVTQSIGTALTLAVGGPNITIITSGTVVGTETYTLRIQFTPVAQTAPLIEYSYALTVT